MSISLADQEILSQVAEALLRNKVVFVIGAGMSRASNVPIFDDIVNEFLKRKFEMMSIKLPPEKIQKLSGRFNPEAILSWYIKPFKEGKREQEFLEELKTVLADRDKPANDAHIVLQHFCQEDYISVVYTTNFDFLLEKGFKSAAYPITDVNQGDLKEISKDYFAVIHLHGHVGTKLSNPEITIEGRIKITEEETFDIETKCFQQFKLDLLNCEFVVFIGHSFNDYDIRHLIFHMKKEFKELPCKFIAVGMVADEYEEIMAKGVWDARGFKFFPHGATAFLEYLEKSVIKAEHKDALDELSKKFGRSPIVIRDMAEKIEKTFDFFREDDGIRYLARTFLGSALK